MPPHQRAAVWLDDREGRIFHVDTEGADRGFVRARQQQVHRHPKDEEYEAFFQEVAEILSEAEEVLLLGPSTAKLQLMRFLQARAPQIEARVVGIESVDQPTDPQLLAYAKHYFGPGAHR